MAVSINNHQELVKEFMLKCNQYSLDGASLIDPVNVSERHVKVLKLRLKMLVEKTQELCQSTLQSDFQVSLLDPLFHILLGNIEQLSLDHIDVKVDEVAKTLADIAYINLGTSLLFDIDSDAVFKLVHEDNLNKIDPVTSKVIKRNLDNKVLGHPNYTPLSLKEHSDVWLGYLQSKEDNRK